MDKNWLHLTLYSWGRQDQWGLTPSDLPYQTHPKHTVDYLISWWKLALLQKPPQSCTEILRRWIVPWLYCLRGMLWRTFMTNKSTYFVVLQGWLDITQTISWGALGSPESVEEQAFMSLIGKELFSVWNKCWPKPVRLQALESLEICLFNEGSMVKPTGVVERTYTGLIMLDSVACCRFQAANRHALQAHFFN